MLFCGAGYSRLLDELLGGGDDDLLDLLLGGGGVEALDGVLRVGEAVLVEGELVLDAAGVLDRHLVGRVHAVEFPVGRLAAGLCEVDLDGLAGLPVGEGRLDVTARGEDVNGHFEGRGVSRPFGCV